MLCFVLVDDIHSILNNQKEKIEHTYIFDIYVQRWYGVANDENNDEEFRLGDVGVPVSLL